MIADLQIITFFLHSTAAVSRNITSSELDSGGCLTPSWPRWLQQAAKMYYNKQPFYMRFCNGVDEIF